MARRIPTRRGTKYVAEPSGDKEAAVYADVYREDSAPTAKSHAATRLKPAPAAIPLTAAITGASIRENREMAAW